MTDPSQHLETIRRTYLNADPKYIRGDLVGSLSRIEMGFQRFGHFLMEFIQNADDAGAHHLWIGIGGDTLTILNDGRIFREPDVDSLCMIGRSSKKTGETIGYLGVGFKSVFLVADKVVITSGGYSFCFDSLRGRADDGGELPWQIIPWDAAPVGLASGSWTTAFEIHLNDPDGMIANQLRAEVAPPDFRSRVILFLRNLEEITISVGGEGTPGRTIKRNQVKSTESYQTYEICDTMGPKSITGRWAVFRKVVEVPPSIRADPITRQFDRQDVRRREVMVAFRLDDQGALQPEEQGTVHMAVFSYLPLRDVATSLKFTVQADFLTGANRSGIQYDASWNRWIAKEVLGLIRDTCVPAFMRTEGWATTFPSILSSVPGTHPILDGELAGPLKSLLETEPWFRAKDGSFVPITQGVRVARAYQSWFTEDDLAILFPGCKLLDENAAIPLEVYLTPKDVIRQYEFQDAINRLAVSKAQTHDEAWFRRLYDSDDKALSSFSNLPLIDEEWRLSSPSDLVIPDEGVEVPESLKRTLRSPHRVLRNAKRPPTVRRLTLEDATKWLQASQLPALAASWQSLSLGDRLTQLRTVKDLWERGQAPTKVLSFVTLPTKRKGWMPPSHILLSKEFHPENHALERLAEEDLFDTSLGFLDPILIEGGGDQDLANWKRFVRELGVDSTLTSNDQRVVSQRVGILHTLKFEKLVRKWTAEELPESTKLGYDVRSQDPQTGKECHIEVKGSKDARPQIHLTVNEFRALSAVPEDYRIYVVTNAWTRPTLYIVSGTEILGDKMEYGVDLGFEKWSQAATEPPRVLCSW